MSGFSNFKVRSEQANNFGGWDFYLGSGPNKKQVSVDQWLLSDPAAELVYNNLLDNGWNSNEALEYTHKTTHPNTYSQYLKTTGADGLPEFVYNGEGIHAHPNTGAPQTDEEIEAYNKAVSKQTTQELLQRNRRVETERTEDWRLRLHLPEKARYLYNAIEPGILTPLKVTNGIIFPYTPNISVQYNADYENYDLVHSNYRGYFYKGSSVQNILIHATFTAQDVNEANYLLAVMHFLRSATKMFYGQDMERGSPPPVLLLTGFGEYQFNSHPCAVTMLSWNLPNDVDFIQAGKVHTNSSSSYNPLKSSDTQKPLDLESAKLARLAANGLVPGGFKSKRPQQHNPQPSPDANFVKIYDGISYVPTKIDLSFTLIPIQTRDQISKEFSLKEYASGKLLKKGYW